MHVLIIEDDPLIALDLASMLEEQGFTSFDHAVSPAAAQASARRRQPDLITSDFQIVAGDGLEAVATIAAHQPLPVVFITGMPESVSARCPEAVIVPKPVLPRDLARAVERAQSQAVPMSLAARG